MCSCPAKDRPTPRGNVVGVDDPEAQVRQVFANIQALLAAAGGGLEHIAEMTLYLRDISHRPLVH